MITGRRWRPGLWAGLLAAMVPSVGTGQAVDLKRVLPEPTPPLCPSAPPVSVSPSPADRAEADRLLARATELTLLGDAGAAVGLLRQAEQLNPASPDVAYRLGAAERDLGQGSNAIVYYCRYLTLSPGAEDGDEVRELVSQLTPPAAPLYDEAAAERFHDGVSAWDGGNATRAYDAFVDAVQMAPELPEAVYNRGLVAAYQDRDDQAAADLRRYLTLRPGAADRNLVEEWIGYLTSPVEVMNATQVLAGGLVVPGLGQVMTGSRVPGFAMMGAGVGAAAAGLLVKTIEVQCLGIPTGGECPPDQIKSETESRDFLVPGLIAYGGISIVGAILAFRRTKSNNAFMAGARRFEPRPGGDRGFELEGPALEASGERVGIRWIRVTF